ncbi:MAG: helix-turn-helix transcriptional regulator [Phycisphaeraceae bacterium]|nr:helix-turn-helix transcriptional regulator [Phycisphaeraceae bacterium]
MRPKHPNIKYQLSVGDRLSIRTLCVALTTIDPSWKADHTTDSFWRLYINNRSGAMIRSDHGDHELIPGQVHLIPGWVTYSCLNKQNIGHFYIHFDVVGIPPALIRQVFDRPFMLNADPIRDKAFMALCDQIEDGDTSSAAVLCRCKSLLYWAFTDLLMQLPKSKTQLCDQAMAAQQAVQPAVQYIDEHYHTNTTNTQLASLCHMSEDYFIRRFRECVGQTPAQYVQERRISEAAKQLIYTQNAIDQIAHDTGFGNRFYFSRVFNKHYDMGPATYRKRQRV